MMMMWATLSLLLGGILGMRFKALVLLPMAPVIVIVAVVFEISWGHGAFWTLLAAVGAVSCLQLGYVMGFVLGRGAAIPGTHGLRSISRP
jgi:hypothetical protein